MQCPGSVQDPNIPGRSLVSQQYMTLDPETLSSTVCLPCGGGASTWGSGLELSSCVCRALTYAVQQPNTKNISCQACTSSAQACPNAMMLPPPSCPRSLSTSQPLCQCALAPFSALNAVQQQGGCAKACIPGYLPTGGTPAVEGSPSPSGSMLYVADSTWTSFPAQVLSLLPPALPCACLGPALAVSGRCLGPALALPWLSVGAALRLPWPCLGCQWVPPCACLSPTLRLPWPCLSRFLALALAAALRLPWPFLSSCLSRCVS